MTIEVLYEDTHVLALNKPSGQLVIPGRGEQRLLPLVQEIEKQFGKKVYIVHRLDQGASGAILFAKDAVTHRTLCQLFEKHEVKKTYLVLVQGRLEAGGQVNAPIQAYGSGRMGVHAKGKPSVTDYQVKERFENSTLLDVSPHSGRRHQIRVHLYSIGHPVMGDTVYGKDRPVGGAPRLMLHARTIDFQIDGNRTTVDARIPEDFKSVLALQPAEEA